MHHHPRSAMHTSVALPAMRLHIVPKISINIDKLLRHSSELLAKKENIFGNAYNSGVKVIKTHSFPKLVQIIIYSHF